MSIKIRLILLFLLVYLLGNIVNLLLLAYFVKAEVIHRSIENMNNSVTPVIDLYKRYSGQGRLNIKELVDELPLDQMGLLIVDKNGKVVYVENLSGELGPIPVKEFMRERSGMKRGFIFLTKRLGQYTLIFLNEPDMSFLHKAILTSFLLSLLLIGVTSLLMVLMVHRLFRPLSYLTDRIKSVSEGDLNIKIERGKGRDEFSLLLGAFADMVEKLRKALSFQRDLMADFAHTLKTPLTYIRGQLDLLSHGFYEDKAKLEVVVKGMKLQTDKMLKILNNLMLLIRLESGIPIRRERFSLLGLFAELDEEYDFVRQTHTFKVEYPQEDVEVLGDKLYIKIALGNLIENSYKHTPPSTTIRLYYSDGCVVVEDNGPGVEDTEKVFERFYRESSDKEGLGLGLSIVRAVANAHRFRLSFQSQKGKGTRVGLCFFIENS